MWFVRVVLCGLFCFIHLHVELWCVFVSDRMSYVVLRVRLFNVIVLNVYSQSEEQSDDSKDTFYGELGRGFIIFLSTI
jgi:hypothetical protein